MDETSYHGSRSRVSRFLLILSTDTYVRPAWRFSQSIREQIANTFMRSTADPSIRQLKIASLPHERQQQDASDRHVGRGLIRRHTDRHFILWDAKQNRP